MTPTTEDLLFHTLAFLATGSALLVVMMTNPIYSALFLALSMSVLGLMFFTLEAYFIAVAQITVYAGAVMVLFVMVLMLFDLHKEHEDILRVTPLNVSKLIAIGALCGILVGVGLLKAPHKEDTLRKTEAAITQTLDQDVTSDASNELIVAETKSEAPVEKPAMTDEPTKTLAKALYTRFLFAFEVLGLVILLVLVGAVALAKSKGGTHHAAH